MSARLRDLPIWHLFDCEPSQDGYARLKEYSRSETIEFERKAAGKFTPVHQDLTEHGKIADLDAWVMSAVGQEMLTRLTLDLQSLILESGQYSLPAHDLRQILYKDATEGLRFARYEKPQGYKSSFVIPMFCHDIGRLLEGKFHGLGLPMSQLIPHGQLSFLLLRDVLKEYPEIPDDLKTHFLYAVLAHSGENGKTYMARAVQTCDRMQMIGPEGFFRAASFMMGLLPQGELAYPRDESYMTTLPHLWGHTSVLAVTEHVGRNMYPNIGGAHMEWQDSMMRLNTSLLWHMAECSPVLKRMIFAPELGEVPETSLGIFKRPFPTAHMMAVMEGAQAEPVPVYTGPCDADHLAARLIHLIESPIGAAPLDDVMKEKILAGVHRAQPQDMPYLASGIEYAACKQRELDIGDDRLLTQILQPSQTLSQIFDTGNAPSFVQAIATAAQRFSATATAPAPQVGLVRAP